MKTVSHSFFSQLRVEQKIVLLLPSRVHRMLMHAGPFKEQPAVTIAEEDSTELGEAGDDSKQEQLPSPVVNGEGDVKHEDNLTPTAPALEDQEPAELEEPRLSLPEEELNAPEEVPQVSSPS